MSRDRLAVLVVGACCLAFGALLGAMAVYPEGYQRVAVAPRSSLHDLMPWMVDAADLLPPNGLPSISAESGPWIAVVVEGTPSLQVEADGKPVDLDSARVGNGNRGICHIIRFQNECTVRVHGVAAQFNAASASRPDTCRLLHAHTLGVRVLPLERKGGYL